MQLAMRPPPMPPPPAAELSLPLLSGLPQGTSARDAYASTAQASGLLLPALPVLLDGGVGDAALISAAIMLVVVALLLCAAAAAAVVCSAPTRGWPSGGLACCCQHSRARRAGKTVLRHEYAAARTVGPEEEEQQQDEEDDEEEGGEEEEDEEDEEGEVAVQEADAERAVVRDGAHEAKPPRRQGKTSPRQPQGTGPRQHQGKTSPRQPQGTGPRRPQPWPQQSQPSAPSRSSQARPHSSDRIEPPMPGDLVMYADPATGLEMPAQVLRVAGDGSFSILVEGIGEVEMAD